MYDQLDLYLFKLPCWRDGRVRLMFFDTTYNNISIIIWRSLLLVEETTVTGKPNELPQVTDKTLSHDVPLPFWYLYMHTSFCILCKCLQATE
jgi:hypothetical protein